ncbi:mite group 2 allergen Lep d 2-like [Oppia nitens]|uniref:mite group 2 allergen Lep d 2-like n=1 Tax=Oppia nitens TaxID=1686743 RepID=UPI0023DBFB55|nr:mite group 2 allergen Lep d 2-like [Oppia nitens]
MLKFVCLALAVAVVSAGLPYKDCANKEVTNVEITGCTTSPCTLHKNQKITITIDYVGNQDTSKADWDLVAKVGELEFDLAALIPGFDKDGCHSQKCPVKKGDKVTFKYDITIPGATPEIEAEVKAVLKGEKGDLFCGTVRGNIKE